MKFQRFLRKTFIFMMAVCMLAVSSCRLYHQKQTRNVKLPILSAPWGDSNRILGDGKTFYSDFCLIKDKLQRWHCIGIGGEDGRDNSLFHAVAPTLLGPYEHRPKIYSEREPAPTHMWAPYAIWRNNRTANLYYAHIRPGEDGECNLRLMVAQAPGLEVWKPYAPDPKKSPELERDNIVFEEPSDRDACIFRDDALDAYIMYYAASLETGEGVIRARTSKDLMHWSEAKTVIHAPPGYHAAESPFVLKRNKLYYLFVSGFDYGRMSLYLSEDPFNFGDADQNRIMELSGHAPEIVTDNGNDYIACAAIASKFGNDPGAHDLMGVFLQQLNWVDADELAIAKIVRK